MADIVQEVESLRNFVADSTLYSRIWMQTLPAQYKSGELSIRFIGDDTTSETGYHFRLDRDYQFVYFGANEFECISKASALQRKLNSTHVIKLKDSDRFLRIGSFSLSQPFKTENTAVFGIIGVLQAQINEARHFEQVPKMAEVTATINATTKNNGGGI